MRGGRARGQRQAGQDPGASGKQGRILVPPPSLSPPPPPPSWLQKVDDRPAPEGVNPFVVNFLRRMMTKWQANKWRKEFIDEVFARSHPLVSQGGGRCCHPLVSQGGGQVLSPFGESRRGAGAHPLVSQGGGQDLAGCIIGLAAYLLSHPNQSTNQCMCYGIARVALSP